MIKIRDYKIISVIYESPATIVYRALRGKDDLPVVIKLLKPDHPSQRKILEYKHEYSTLCNIDSKGAIKAYALKKYKNSMMIVFEDIAGSSLKDLFKTKRPELKEFLLIAIRIARALEDIHNANIIHTNINPSNIIFNSKTSELKIIDFGSSSVVSDDNLTPHQKVTTCLPYISPEQTGRMNRLIDFRSDFYSSGATLYELLTGQIPFETYDSLKIAHYCIAVLPEPVSKIMTDIPDVVSDIVMKLLAKTPEERYQTAHGIKSDLQKCFRLLAENKKIEQFDIGGDDISDRLHISQNLYGREKEVKVLMDTFEKVRLGSLEMLLVKGFSGIGKTSLIAEVYKPITESSGYFVSGKFDQYQRNIPYSAVIEAFRELVQQILSETDEELEKWREKLAEALDQNGGVIVDIIPELELIIGKQPQAPELGLIETQNRFNLVFQNFIHGFCEPGHPLVIFLDDLQWVDSASLKLLELIMTDDRIGYLFIIGAYRDNEVFDTDELSMYINQFQEEKARINTIKLTGLSLPYIQRFIADSLYCGKEDAGSLSELIYQKTAGNPFFTREFLKSLYSENLLVFGGSKDNRSRQCWKWDISQIKEKNITDNVVELLTNRIKKLKSKSLHVLQTAACIGNRFDMHTLSAVYEKDSVYFNKIENFLWEASRQGLLFFTGKEESKELFDLEFKFAHDKIQQAAYYLLSEKERERIHLKIGKAILKSVALPQEKEDKIFSIVNQMNLGTAFISSREEKYQLAELNLFAGKKAKFSAAYEPALRYFKAGIRLLEKDIWKRKYDLILDLYTNAAEAAYLGVKFDQMEEFAQIVLENAVELLDKIKVYEVKIQAYAAEGKLQKAKDTGLSVLNMLGIKFPENPNKLHIMFDLIKVKSALFGRSINKLIDLPKMNDPVKLACMRIMWKASASFYYAIPYLIILIALKAVRLSIKHGNSPESSLFYAGYGIILCTEFKDFDSGYQFGKLALNIAKQLNDKDTKTCNLFVFNNLVRHYKEHLNESIKPFSDLYKTGQEIGDFEFAALSIINYSLYSFYTGKELKALKSKTASNNTAIIKLRQQPSLNLNRICLQSVLNLLGESEDPCLLIGKACDEQKMLSVCIDENNINELFHIYFYKIILCYIFEEYSDALENADNAQKYWNGARSLPAFFLFPFYDSLVRLAVFQDSSKQQQQMILKKIHAYRKKMKKSAQHAPMNYLHKFYLVQAELARVTGKDNIAADYYDSAIHFAQQHEYINDQAIANELAAKFYFAKNKTTIAGAYITEARYCYKLWGAAAKAAVLEKKYNDFFAKAATDSDSGVVTISYENLPGQKMDIASVMKASQTISCEIDLEVLPGRLMNIMLENAGAQKGFLISKTDANLVITAYQYAERRIIVPDLTEKPVEECGQLCVAIVQYVFRTGDKVVLDNAAKEGNFTADKYVRKNKPLSIICIPVIHHNKLTGVLYLENNLVPAAFTQQRVEILVFLSTQAAISIENAGLYGRLKQSEENYRQLFENAVEGVFQITPVGRVISANPTLEKMLGYDQGELTDNDFDILKQYINPADRKELIENLIKYDSVSEFETQFYKKDKTHIWICLNARAAKDPNGNLSCIEGFVKDITEKKQAEDELTRLSQHIMEKQEKERAEIAKELHDQLGQNLTVLHLKTAQLRRHLKNQGYQDAVGQISLMDDSIKQIMEDVHNMALGLRPDLLDRLGLVDALEWYLADFEKRTDIKTVFKHTGFSEVNNMVSTAAYRIVQEALTNVLRHASADKVHIDLTIQSGILNLRIIDNGCGFNKPNYKRLGIAIMKERAQMAGGALTVESGDKGVVVCFRKALGS